MALPSYEELVATDEKSKLPSYEELTAPKEAEAPSGPTVGTVPAGALPNVAALKAGKIESAGTDPRVMKAYETGVSPEVGKAMFRPLFDLTGMTSVAKLSDVLFPKNPVSAVSEGLMDSGGDFVSAMSSPKNASLMLAGGALGKLGTVLLSAGFEAQALRQAPEQWKQFKTAYDAGDYETATRVGTGLVSGVVLPAAAAAIHGAAPPKASLRETLFSKPETPTSPATALAESPVVEPPPTVETVSPAGITPEQLRVSAKIAKLRAAGFDSELIQMLERDQGQRVMLAQQSVGRLRTAQELAMEGEPIAPLETSLSSETERPSTEPPVAEPPPTVETKPGEVREPPNVPPEAPPAAPAVPTDQITATPETPPTQGVAPTETGNVSAKPLPDAKTISNEATEWEDKNYGRFDKNKTPLPESANSLPVGTIVKSEAYRSEGEITITGPPDTSVNGIIRYPANFPGTGRQGGISARTISEIVSRPERQQLESQPVSSPATQPVESVSGAKPEIEPGITAAIAEIQRRNAPSEKTTTSPETATGEGTSPALGKTNEPTPPNAAPEVGAGTPAPLKGTHAETEVARADVGVDPYERELTQTWGEAAEQARKKDASSPGYDERLAQNVAKKPRPVTDEEHVSLLRNWRRAEQGHQLAIEDVNKATDATAKELASDRLAEAKDHLQEAFDAIDKSGSAAGRGFNARKMILKEFYTPEALEARVRAAKGGKALNETELKRVQQHIDDIQKASLGSAKVESQRSVDARYADKVNGTLGERVKSSKPKTIQEALRAIGDEAAAARERILKERGEMKWSDKVDPCLL